MYKFLIAIKSGNVSSFLTAYNFVTAALKNSNIIIHMIFFYQDGTNILLKNETTNLWERLLSQKNLCASICTAAYKKRGLTLKPPFKAASIIEFIATCDLVDRVVQF